MYVFCIWSGAGLIRPQGPYHHPHVKKYHVSPPPLSVCRYMYIFCIFHYTRKRQIECVTYKGTWESPFLSNTKHPDDTMYYLVGMPLYIFDDEKYIIHVNDLLYNMWCACAYTLKETFKIGNCDFFFQGGEGGGEWGEVLVSLSV